MDSEEKRCESIWNGIGMSTQPVRCVWWGDHSVKYHCGFDENGMSVHWEDEDAWQPPEDRRMGQEPEESGGLRPASAFKQERDEWKDRCLEAEQMRDQHYHSWRNAVAREQDWKRRNRELNETASKLSERISGLMDEMDAAREYWMRIVQEATQQRDAAWREVADLGAQLVKSTDEAGEAVGVASERLAALGRQVANQAVTIQELRERLRGETNR